MPTATEEGLAIMKQQVEDGTATNGADAYTQLCKSRPDLVERYTQECQQTSRPVRKAPPLDYAQRQAMSKQTDFPLTVPPARTPLETWEVMVTTMMRDNPGMSLDAAARAVFTQAGGAAAYERYRQEMIFGRR
jgi:hypothetical protein